MVYRVSEQQYFCGPDRHRYRFYPTAEANEPRAWNLADAAIGFFSAFVREQNSAGEAYAKPTEPMAPSVNDLAAPLM
jgi:hypothetical protein